MMNKVLQFFFNKPYIFPLLRILSKLYPVKVINYEYGILIDILQGTAILEFNWIHCLRYSLRARLVRLLLLARILADFTLWRYLQFSLERFSATNSLCHERFLFLVLLTHKQRI